MKYRRPIITLALSAALMIAAGSTTTTSAAHARRLAPPPIHVATPTDGSPITPYFFPYGWGYRYNSPGPVYSRLDYWGPLYSCRLWRYNYLYWVC
jgi:hypothetical protein